MYVHCSVYCSPPSFLIIVCVCVRVQELMQEELKKERSQVEELREAQSGLEKERSRLSAELKSLAGKSEKVSC